MRGIFILLAMSTGPLLAAPRQRAKPAAATKTTAPAKTNTARAAASGVFAGSKPVAAKSLAVDDIETNPCKKAFWSCMDMFCINENENGMRCQCSNESVKMNAEYNKILSEMEDEIAKSDAAADALESGEGLGWMRNKTSAEVAADCEDDEDISCKTGAAKLAAAQKLCEPQTTDECRANLSFAKLQYSQNIRNDCSAYALAIKDLKVQGAAALYAAKKAARDAALEKLESTNKLDSAQCADELRACMSADDVCGADWSRCLAGGVEEKKFHCEKVLDQCQSVAAGVWDGFAANIKNTLNALAIDKSAAANRNCLSNISECIAKSCRDDIEGKGVDSMDSCLSRPDMAASFCKVEMDECGIGTDGPMWAFIKQKLGAMRVDACMTEVKNCLASEDRCGEDYVKCLGMDLNSLYRICPVDKLVACKKDNPNFAMQDLGDMLMGIFLNIDNKAYDQCQELVVEKMTEICGSVVNCDKFTDPKMGARGLRYQEENGMYLITGIVNWGGIDIELGDEWSKCAGEKDDPAQCGDFPRPGNVKVREYAEEMARAGTMPEVKSLAAASNATAEDELRSVAGEINRVAELLENDPKISMCTNGRDMSQITGKSGEKTEARFPQMTAIYRRIIAEAALSAASKNQNVAVMELMRQAEGKADLAAMEYMCYMKPHMVNSRNAPDPNALNSGRSGTFGSIRIIGRAASKSDIAALSGKQTIKMDDILTKEMTAAFSPETKNCRICVNDIFYGKRKYVEPRAKQAEQLKEMIESGELDRASVKTAAALAIGLPIAGVAAVVGVNALVAALSASMVLTMVPVAGWIAAGIIATGAAVAAILMGTTKHEDPMEQVYTAQVDYCVDEPMGE